jgi:hypothetical protein
MKIDRPSGQNALDRFQDNEKEKILKQIEKTKGLGLQIPADLHKKLKIKSAESDMTIKEFIIKLIKENV